MLMINTRLVKMISFWTAFMVDVIIIRVVEANLFIGSSRDIDVEACSW